MMRLSKMVRFAFAVPKEEYARFYVVRFRFAPDGYYLSSAFMSRQTSIVRGSSSS